MRPPRVRSAAWLACVASLACKVDSTDFQRAPTLEAVALEGPTPPPAQGPEGEKLYQLLFAGELGPQAADMGQHARMLVWLGVMDFSEVQLDALVRLLDRLDAAREDQQAQRVDQDLRELTILGPIYQRIAEAWSAGATPTEAELAAFATELQAARATLYGDEDPRAAELARTTVLMDHVGAWVTTLSPQQQHDLAQCRFFLRRRLGPLLNPGDYGDLTGISWDGGDFRGINTTFRDDDEHHMDIGGLWSTEHMRAPPHLYLDTLQLKALVVMALKEPGLRAAIAARRSTPSPTIPESP